MESSQFDRLIHSKRSARDKVITSWLYLLLICRHCSMHNSQAWSSFSIVNDGSLSLGHDGMHDSWLSIAEFGQKGDNESCAQVPEMQPLWLSVKPRRGHFHFKFGRQRYWQFDPCLVIKKVMQKPQNRQQEKNRAVTCHCQIIGSRIKSRDAQTMERNAVAGLQCLEKNLQ